jgi:hypothetical protein
MCADFDRRRQPEPRRSPHPPHPRGSRRDRHHDFGSPDLVLDTTGNPLRLPAPTGPGPGPWNAPYNRPMVYDRENYNYARSQAQPLGRSFGPVRWGTLGDRERTHMNPDWIDRRGVMPGADYSRTRALGEGRGPSFAGRGPKGWRRSDERVREDVCEALAMHPAIDAGDLEVEVRDGVVMLHGTVDDRTSKRLAVDVAESISGVAEVRSEVRARSRQERARIDKGREDEVARR